MPPIPPEVFDPPNVAPRGGGETPAFLVFSEDPVLVEFIAPRYPQLAREAGIQGIVRIHVRVDERGRVVDATVVDSDVTPAMDAAAVRAALHCRFKAARQRTEPVSATVIVPFSFSIR
jgi:periplasmic protein TonB